MTTATTYEQLEAQALMKQCRGCAVCTVCVINSSEDLCRESVTELPPNPKPYGQSVRAHTLVVAATLFTYNRRCDTSKACLAALPALAKIPMSQRQKNVTATISKVLQRHFCHWFPTQIRRCDTYKKCRCDAFIPC